MSGEYDLAVIGGGLAGLTAARAALSRGLKTLLIAKAPPTLTLTWAGLEVLRPSGKYSSAHLGDDSSDRSGADSSEHLGDVSSERSGDGSRRQPGDGSRRQPGDDSSGAFGEVERLIAARPGHPYALAGLPALREGLAIFGSLVGLPAGEPSPPEGPRLVTNLLGRGSPVYWAPEALLRRPSKGEPVLVAGLEGFWGFSETLVAGGLAHETGAEIARTRLKVAANLNLPVKPAALAEAFEREEVLSRTIDELAPLAARASLIILPSVLGLEAHEQVARRLAGALGLPAGEIPLAPPSIPGLRLFRAARRNLVAAGLDFWEGFKAQRLISREGVLTSVELATPAGRIEARAKEFILATGSILGGGLIARRGRLVEPLLGAVASDTDDPEALLAPSLDGPHPVESMGLTVDSEMRPLKSDGRPFHPNLRAAGSILGGADRRLEGSKDGVDLATAIAAVRSLAS